MEKVVCLRLYLFDWVVKRSVSTASGSFHCPYFFPCHHRVTWRKLVEIALIFEQ